MMEAVTRLHNLAGPIVLVGLAVLTAIAATLAVLRRPPVRWPDSARRILLALVVFEASLGLVLVLRGGSPAEGIHWFYGVAIILVLLAPAAIEARNRRTTSTALALALALATLFAWRLWGSG